MAAQGYISLESGETPTAGTGGGPGPDTPPAHFRVTDKSLDFLGYRALRDLLGSRGRSSVGRHETRELATGVEAGGASKPYEFGDTLNLDASGTILNAVQRAPAGQDGAIDVQYRDLMVAQGRVPELVRDGPHARLQPQHDPVRRGSLHAGQAGGAGPVPPDPQPVSRRRPERGPLPRLGGGDPAQAARPGARRSLLHEYARRAPPRAPHPRAPAQGHAADRDDHRRQALRPDAGRRTDIPQRVRPRPRRSSARRSPRWPTAGAPAS